MHRTTSGNVEQSILVLQGGGALGAYQAGAYEYLAGHRGGFDWVAGISIGSINAAIIAGNTPELRVKRIRQFWEQVTSRNATTPLFNSSWTNALVNEVSAAATTLVGVPGFFDLRFPPASMMPPGSRGARPAICSRSFHTWIAARASASSLNTHLKISL